MYREEVTISDIRGVNRREVKVTRAVHGIVRAVRRRFHNDEDLADVKVGRLAKYLNSVSPRFTYHVFDLGNDLFRVTMTRRNTIDELNSEVVKKDNIGIFLAREIACEISWE